MEKERRPRFLLNWNLSNLIVVHFLLQCIQLCIFELTSPATIEEKHNYFLGKRKVHQVHLSLLYVNLMAFAYSTYIYV